MFLLFQSLLSGVYLYSSCATSIFTQLLVGVSLVSLEEQLIIIITDQAGLSTLLAGPFYINYRCYEESQFGDSYDLKM